MAIPKYVKVGGSYYEGQTLAVSSAVGDYVLNMTFTAAGAANAMSVIPNQYGEGDTFSAYHINTAGDIVHTLAKDVPNVGRNAAWKFDYPALLKIPNGDTLRVTYTNTATEAMTVYVVLEQIH
jgi:hypothetical protein